MESQVIGAQARGIVVIESVVWLMTLAPLIFAGSILAMATHNRSVLRTIPEALLQDRHLIGLRLEGGISGVEWVADSNDLLANVSAMVDAAVVRGKSSTLQAQQISAKGCFSIFVVDEVTGKVIGESERRCETKGPHGARLELDSRLNAYYGKAAGIPFGAESATTRFINRLVVIGLSVGAEMSEFTALFGERYVEFGGTSVPRQEVVL